MATAKNSTAETGRIVRRNLDGCFYFYGSCAMVSAGRDFRLYYRWAPTLARRSIYFSAPAYIACGLKIIDASQ